MLNRPSGTVTFLFTDTEGSANNRASAASREAHARYQAAVRAAIEAHEGYAYKLIGDSFQAAFSTAPQALAAAIDAQRALEIAQTGTAGETATAVRARMSLHTGVTEERENDYYGPILNRLARLLGASHAGQITLTQATQELLGDSLPEGVILRDLGEHRLRDLIRPERVFQVVAPGLPSDFPPLNTLETSPNNLPLQPTVLIGRQHEVVDCCELLRHDDVWLLTLTGPAGAGKTRLGLQVAAELLGDFSDGAFLVSLALVSDPAQVMPTIAQTLGVREEKGQPLLRGLHDYLRDKQMLLLLDNFEQVVDAAPLVAELLQSSRQLKVLVTSRTMLRLSIEREYPVPPLSLPSPKRLPSPGDLMHYEAVALFVARAQAVDPRFTVTEENAAAIAEICYRLDGLPLAIELAAARTRVMSPQQMLPRLQSRLKFLTGGARDLPARQQTLRGTIDWSYNLLEEEEKRLFALLSVFAGGGTFEALEAVVSQESPDIDLLSVLESLIDKNLIRQQSGATDDSGTQADEEPRFTMLQTLREYARELLAATGDEAEVRRTHAYSFLELAEIAAQGMAGSDQIKWLNLLEVEHDNLREALRYALEYRDAELGMKLGGALWRFWYIRSHYTEGANWLKDVLALPEGDPHTAARARALKGAANLAYMRGNNQDAWNWQQESLIISEQLGDREGMAASYNNLGHLSWRQGEYEKAHTYLEKGLDLSRAAGSRTLEALNLNNLGNLAHDQGDYAAARDYHSRGLAVFTSMGDEWGMAMTTNDMGNALFELGDYDGARTLFEKGMALETALGNKRGVARVLNYLAQIAHNQSDYSSAHELSEQALVAFRDLGDKRGIADALHNLGKVAYRQGDYHAARTSFEESLSIRESLGDKRGMAESRNNLGLVGLAQGDYDYADEQLGQSLEIWRETGNKGTIPTSLNNLGLVAIMQGRYAEAEKLLEESLQQFQASGEKLGVGFALLNMGLAASGSGEYARARPMYEHSMEIFRELGDKLHMATCLMRMAGLEVVSGRPEVGARLGAAAEAQLAALGTPIPPFEAPYYRPAVRAARAQLGEDRFTALWEEGRKMTVEQAVSYALDGAGEAVSNA